MLQLHLFHGCGRKATESNDAASVTLLLFGLCPVTSCALHKHDCHMSVKPSVSSTCDPCICWEDVLVGREIETPC